MTDFNDRPVSSSVATTLSTLVDQYGPMLFNDPSRLKLLLVQSHPDATTTIDAILAALEAEVPQRLMATHDDASVAALLPRMADHVAQRDGVPHKAAVQAVRAWALALALPDDGLDDGAPVIERPVKAAVHFASVVTPLATRAPIAPTPSHDEPAKADAFADTVIATPVAPAAADETPSIAPTEFVPLPLRPLTPARTDDSQPAATAAAASPAPFAVPPAVGRVVEPPLRHPADAVPSRSRGRAIAALALAAIVIVAGFAWRTWQGTPTDRSAVANVATPLSDPAPTRSAPESPVATSAAEPPPTSAPSSAPADTSTADKAPSADAPPPGNAPVAVPSSVTGPSPVAVPSSVTGSSPATATAPAGSPLVIARIDVPRVVADEAFAVRLVVTGPVDEVVAVEERYLDRAGARVASRTVPTRTLKAATGGTITVPVRAFAGGDRSSMEFLLVDRGGMRSAPKRIAFDVTSPDGTPNGTNSARLGAGTDSARDVSTGCTPSTCGVVVESRALEGGTALYRIVVMNDARESSAFSAPYRLQAGTRVRLTGGRVLPVAAAP